MAMMEQPCSFTATPLRDSAWAFADPTSLATAQAVLPSRWLSLPRHRRGRASTRVSPRIFLSGPACAGAAYQTSSPANDAPAFLAKSEFPQLPMLGYIIPLSITF